MSSAIKNIGRVWGQMTSKKKIHFYGLISYTIFCSIIEFINIGISFVFMSMLFSPNKLYESNYSVLIKNFFNINNFFLGEAIFLLFFIFCLLTGICRIFLYWVNSKFAFILGHELSSKIYSRVLGYSYEIHVSTNKSEFIEGVSGKVYSLIYGLVVPFLQIISSICMIFFIILALLIFTPLKYLIGILILGLTYLSISYFTKSMLKMDSIVIDRNTVKIMQYLQEGLGSIRDMIIDRSQKIFIEKYNIIDKDLRISQGRMHFLSLFPRALIELLALGGLSLYAFYQFHQGNGDTEVLINLGMIGVFAIVAQRTLPLLQQWYGAWATMHGLSESVNSALEFLDQPNIDSPIDEDHISFNRSIRFDNVSYQYPNSDTPALNKINIEIFKGEKIGIVGKTGSGKSTFIDVLIGLLKPTDGYLEVDNKKLIKSSLYKWQQNISHIPQKIYLSDTSVIENIAFSLELHKVDLSRIKVICEGIGIDVHINSLSQGYKTRLGDDGASLSGGQRQSIGIARALYKNKPLIVMDEATSSLDIDTENMIIDYLKKTYPNVTIIMVAHRITSLRNCDRIIHFSNGEITNIMKYEQLVSN